MARISRDRLNEIKGRLEKASQGELELFDSCVIRTVPTDPSDEDSSNWIIELSADGTDADMDFYLHARDDIQALIDSVGAVGEPITGSKEILQKIVQQLLLDGWTVKRLLEESTVEDSSLAKAIGYHGLDAFNDIVTVLDNIVKEAASNLS